MGWGGGELLFSEKGVVVGGGNNRGLLFSLRGGGGGGENNPPHPYLSARSPGRRTRGRVLDFEDCIFFLWPLSPRSRLYLLGIPTVARRKRARKKKTRARDSGVRERVRCYCYYCYYCCY